MAKRNDSLIDVFCILSWRVSVITAFIVFAVSHYLIPAIQFENFYLKAMAPSSPILGKMVSMVLLGCAALSAVNSMKKTKRLDSQKDIVSIRALGWKEFEELVGEAYRRQGYSVVENHGAGPDGGVDLVLNKDGMTTLVQCKHWKILKVGVKVIRELFGVMASQGAQKGIVISSGEFTKDAIDFANSNSVELINGTKLLAMIGEVKKEHRIEKPSSVLENVKKGCPACGAEMVLRIAKKGQHAGSKFWGCSNFPTCKKTEKYVGNG
ncbi:MAG: DUF2034 domain-containing protein [Proteobacteria bacterium]|nr:DUF2034 domain-containing protein [Pseudomonadota bacterium]